MQIENLPQELPSKTVILIAGATGVGKTAVAVDLALHFNTEIISADSRQCFKELNIGVARPSLAELKAVKHHFIASHSIHEKVDATVFEQYALEKSAEIFLRKDIVIMAGGTGLYIKAFCEGLDDIPEIDPSRRESIAGSYREKGLVWLQQEVKEKDPVFYQSAEIQNPQRLMRALEIIESTGQSVMNFRKGVRTKRNFNIIPLGLALPKEILHAHIHTRVDKMLEKGLVEEVRLLQSFKNLNALNTVGYSEIFDFLDHKLSLEEAVALIKTNTRHYAKRQMTWFKKDKELPWFSPAEPEKIKSFIDSKYTGS